MSPPFDASLVEYAYRHALFPMADDAGRVAWYRPDPRAVIPIDGFHTSRSLRKRIRRREFEIRINTDFAGVMRACSERAEGTWISDDFVRVYCELFRQGKAHSVEAWQEDRLVGGTYGVALGAAFMAESMFHRVTDGSKVALSALVSRLRLQGFRLLDVQFLTQHLESLGAMEIPGGLYYALLRDALESDVSFQ